MDGTAKMLAQNKNKNLKKNRADKKKIDNQYITLIILTK